MALTIKAINNGSNLPATDEEVADMFLNYHLDGSGEFDIDLLLPNGRCRNGSSVYRFEVVEND